MPEDHLQASLKNTLDRINVFQKDELDTLKRSLKVTLDKVNNSESLEPTDFEVLGRTVKRFMDRINNLQKNDLSSLHRSIKINIEKSNTPDLLKQAIENAENGLDLIEKITELNTKLRSTDHVVLEVLEAQLMGDKAPHDIYSTYKQRNLWRDEIDKLSQQFYNENINVDSVVFAGNGGS